MKKIFLLIILSLSSISFSQNKINSIVDKIDTNLSLYSPDSKKGNVFLNIQEKILDIDGFEIPLSETKELFISENRIYKGKTIIGHVDFTCVSNCIKNTNSNEMISGIGFGFTSKKEAYNFINLIYQLKKELLNE